MFSSLFGCFMLVCVLKELFSMLPPSSQTHPKDLATGLCSFLSLFFPFKTHHTKRLKQIKKNHNSTHTMEFNGKTEEKGKGKKTNPTA